jgi:hypothetical protein
MKVQEGARAPVERARVALYQSGDRTQFRQQVADLLKIVGPGVPHVCRPYALGYAGTML